MSVSIRPATSDDLVPYTKLLQQTYVNSYVSPELGITKECFSESIFNTSDTQAYLLSNLQNNEKQKAWLAFSGETLIGSITIKKLVNEYEVTGFYVATEFQGQGIGKKLWQKAMTFVQGKDIVLDLYAHNTRSVEMYKKWGFEIDRTRGKNGYFYRHWTEWPKGVEAKCIYMRLRNLGK